MTVRLPATLALCLWATAIASAQEAPPAENTACSRPRRRSAAPAVTAAAPAPVPAPVPPSVAPATRAFDASADFRIGPEDVLDVLVWKNLDLSRTVPVRPDGKISLPLVNDIQAAGLTPTELRQQLTSGWRSSSRRRKSR